MNKVAFWNTADLLPPPENSCEIEISLNDATRFQTIFQDASDVFKVLDKLDLEAALLSRIIWKSKSRFRADKMLHRLEAVNRGLLKYLALGFPNVYETFEKKLRNPKLRNAVLPSRQMLEWVLVRTQGFARLFCYLAHNCEEAAKVWIDPLKRGLLWTVSPVVLGILSRIWVIVKYLIVHACKWYTELLPFRLSLKSMGLRWLPSDYVLPKDIVLWLNMPHITDVVEKHEESKLGLSLMAFLEMSDEEDCSSSSKVEKQDSRKQNLMNFLDTSDKESNKEGKQHKSKKTSLMDLLDDSNNEKECVLPSLSLSSNMQDMNNSVDIGEFVSREMEVEPAEANKIPKKKKLKNQNTTAERELNTKLAADVQSTVTSTDTAKKKKKSKTSLANVDAPASVAEKLKNEDFAVATTKKKKVKKMDKLPKAGGEEISEKKKTKAGLLAIKEKKLKKTKKVCTL